MAVDEALWNAATSRTRPTICLHRFDAECVTLGFAQPHGDLAAAGLDSLPWTRRLTGGGAIHHHEQTLSFSLTGFDASAVSARRPGPMARTAGELLQTLWERLGLRTEALARGTSATQSAPLCADRLCAGDILHGATKVAGIAQRHRQGRSLVHVALMFDRAATPQKRHPDLREVLGVDLEPCPLTPRERDAARRIRTERYLTDRWNRRR